MKILFVTLNGIKDEAFGGAKASIRNYKSLMKYGEVIPYEIKKRSNFKSLISCFERNMPPQLNEDHKSILRIINDEQIDLCFMDSSLLGNLMAKITIPCVTFFHNCESDYISVRFGSKWGLKKSIYQKLADENEKKTIDKSAIICSFTERDSLRLKELYGRKADIVIPLSIEDKYKKMSNVDKTEVPKVILFGPALTANLEGFEWFAKNVSPYLNAKTIIAGKGFEDFKELESDKVEVRGYVDSLPEFYASGSCVAIPLLSGGGMKIKTAEALMFGKYIFGTNEAFVGYENTISEKVGRVCNTAEDFINHINNYLLNNSFRFNEYSREVYLSNFSPEATQKQFDELIKMIEEIRKNIA